VDFSHSAWSAAMADEQSSRPAKTGGESAHVRSKDSLRISLSSAGNRVACTIRAVKPSPARIWTGIDQQAPALRFGNCCNYPTLTPAASNAAGRDCDPRARMGERFASLGGEQNLVDVAPLRLDQ